MKSNIFVYILLIVLTTFFAYLSSKIAVNNKKELWKTAPFYIMLSVFALLVGTRFMVGVDYENYMQLIKSGDSHYYYNHIEFLNRFFIDITYYLNLDFYWWFIMMAFVQIFFIAIAVKEQYIKIFPWIIFSFFLLYISFYLNGVRQGAALSCFIFAVTFIKERKLVYYLLFIFIGSLFHRSILVWLPVYWLVNKEFLKSIKLQYFIFFVFVLVMPRIIDFLYQIFLPFIEFIGYGDKTEGINLANEDIKVGSGLGVLFRYIRWCIIIAFYNKLKTVVNNEELIPIYNLFFVGIIMDSATYHIIVLNRIIMYGAVFEIFILAVLFYYSTITKFKQDKIIILVLLFLQFIMSFLPVIIGKYQWVTIWDAPEYILR